MDATSTSSPPPASPVDEKLPGLTAAFPGAVLSSSDFRGDLIVVIDPARVRDVIAWLKGHTELPFPMLMDLFAMDYLKTQPEPPGRFAVVYNLYSPSHHRRVHLKAYLPEEKPEIDSIHDLYRAANWFEREAWDLFGVRFNGHPNLHRILCHNEFVGHPLRKDYPADGYQRLKTAAPSTGI